MSEVVSLTGGASATIYGTFSGAVSYLTGMFGDQYTGWLALTVDDRKRTLIAATRFLDRQTWVDDAKTFALRDALTSPEGVPLFQLASYELAALVADDPSIVTLADQGSNLQSAGAGGAQVAYFSPTSARQGSASRLPPILMDLIGWYLSTAAVGGADGGDGVSGDCRNPFDHLSDFDRSEPF